MLSETTIRQKVETAIKNVTGVTNFNPDSSLIDRDSPIIPANFLYIFEQLEKELQLPVNRVFEKYGYEVMTINNLTAAFFQIQNPE